MGDRYYDKVVLLLPMKGSNNGTTFTDYSPSPKTVTRNGDTKTVTAESKFYGSSGYFDGDGDYLRIDQVSASLAGKTAFTIEGWLRFASTPTDQTFFAFNDKTTGNNDLVFWNSRIFSTNYGSTYYSTPVPDDSQWHHLAFVFTGSAHNVYLDGASICSISSSVNTVTTNSAFCLGNEFDSSSLTPGNYLHGNLQDVQVTAEVARYTDTFTPPTRLTGNSLSGVILDDAGDPVARRLILAKRLLPTTAVQTTSSAVDGSYSFTELVTAEHYIVCLDDDAGDDYNAKILDRLTPA